MTMSLPSSSPVRFAVIVTEPPQTPETDPVNEVADRFEIFH